MNREAHHRPLHRNRSYHRDRDLHPTCCLAMFDFFVYEESVSKALLT